MIELMVGMVVGAAVAGHVVLRHAEEIKKVGRDHAARNYFVGWRDGIASMWIHAKGFTGDDGVTFPAMGFEVSARMASRHAEDHYRQRFGEPMQAQHGMSVFDQHDASQTKQ